MRVFKFWATVAVILTATLLGGYWGYASPAPTQSTPVSMILGAVVGVALGGGAIVLVCVFADIWAGLREDYRLWKVQDTLDRQRIDRTYVWQGHDTTYLSSVLTATERYPVLTSTGRLNVRGSLRQLQVGEQVKLPVSVGLPYTEASKLGIRIKTTRQGNFRIVERVS